MQRSYLLALCLIGCLSSFAMAQADPAKVAAEKAAAEKAAVEKAAKKKVAEDELTAKTQQLEAELGKYKDTSLEAADAMTKLAELYYADGRVFGLIRVARRFVASHPTDERHKAMMLKLIDAFEATSRQADMVTACRQFIGHYPEAPETSDIEERLVLVLDRMGKTAEAAQAYGAAWRRQPTPANFKFGLAAVRRNQALNTPESRIEAAKLAEEVFDKAPDGTLAEELGMHAFNGYRGASDWAKANLMAGKMTKRNLPASPAMKWTLLRAAGDNFGNLGQQANSAEAYKRARAIKDEPGLIYNQVLRLYSASVKADVLAPVVAEIQQKYPQAAERYLCESYLAQSYLRDGDKANALKLIAALLPVDAVSNNQGAVYIQQIGTEPAQFAEAERVMLDAILKNKTQGAYLRYNLAFELYRDRIKDLAKTRQTLRDLITQSPDESNYAQQAVHWLLNNPGSDAEFNADLALVVKARIDNLQLMGFGQRLGEWITAATQTAATNKDEALKARVAAATAALNASNTDFVKGWIANNWQYTAPASQFRTAVIDSKEVDKLPDPLAYALLSAEAYYMRHYSAANLRPRAPEFYEKLAKRFPKDQAAAAGWVESAYNYATPANAHEAVRHQVAAGNMTADTTNWYYLLLSADRTLDKPEDTDEVKKANLAKNKEIVLLAINYIKTCQEKLGVSYERADQIAGLYVKYGMEAEGMVYAKAHSVPFEFFTGEAGEMLTVTLRLANSMPAAEKVAFLQKLMALNSYYYGSYAQALAGHYLYAADLANFEKTIADARTYQIERATLGIGFDEATLNTWMGSFGVAPLPAGSTEKPREVSEADKNRVLAAIASLKYYQASAIAELRVLAGVPEESVPPMQRLLRYSRLTLFSGNAHHYWDQLIPFANDLLTKKDYLAAASLVTGMLANITNNDDTRRARGREIVAQSYSRVGAVGLTIDDNSPIAPLLQAALMLRLGDRRLAFDAYTSNQPLFDEHRDEMPVDFLLFVCENHMAAGGDENHNRVEEILRGWIVKFSESMQFDDATKAQVQLMLAKNFFRAGRYEISRSEFTTVKNRFPNTREALEGEFGIGETFMQQKIYDQAEAVFDKLAESHESDVAVRALFLRGVLAHRKGEPDEARKIFRTVLERVPDFDLANQTLFNLSTVYEGEERYTDQLQLLRIIGRFSDASKRWHRPGDDLSIVIQDNDLGVSRGQGTVPVIITTEPGGDSEVVNLTSGGAGKGLFSADVRTRLGKVAKGDNVLQLSGNDVIRCDYTEQFKKDFKHIPLSDVQIRIAADAKFEIASSLILDEEEASFSVKLQKQLDEKELDQRVSQDRPTNQIKPGNPIYLQVKDADCDRSDEADKIVIKLAAQSGDEVQVTLTETGDHTGVFTATSSTGELPAGAIASDAAIQHSPLMAIDRDAKSYWLSEPDGATPKELTVDMKDLKLVSRVRISTPDPTVQAPVRGDLLGSNDGRFWFRLASNPPEPPAPPVAGEFAAMKRRIYPGDYTGYTTWNQIVDLSKNAKPTSEDEVSEMTWGVAEEDENAKKPYAALWHGKIVQERAGAMRIAVQGITTALVIDGRVEIPVGRGLRTADVWLEAGTHDVTVFAAGQQASLGLGAVRAHASLKATEVQFTPFSEDELNLKASTVKINASEAQAPQVLTADGDWEFRFSPVDLRFVRFVIREYLGDAVAINNVEIRGDEDDQVYIPTESDVLALANNDVLEMAGGDVLTATYSDERTQINNGNSQPLTQKMTATYFDAGIATIAYDFVENQNGTVTTLTKDLIRVDPGDRFIVEIVDYDRDQTDSPDTVKFQVIINDGEPVELTATEDEPYSGSFTKEVDTSAKAESGKLQVKPGDRIYCRYIDTQNTFPGHSVPRESVLYVRQPSEGKVRVLETRYTPADKDKEIGERISFGPPPEGKEVSSVAFELPLTIEVVDRDAAKDSRSSVNVTVTTTDGAQIEVTCKVSDAYRTKTAGYAYASQTGLLSALDEGRFIGQVILQLGGKSSPDIVPLSAEMPRNLIGGGKLPEDQEQAGETLITRVLNVTGKDVVSAVYSDELRPGGKQDLEAKGRLITNAQLRCTDRNYEKNVTQLHVGEKLFVMVADADQDTTDERDTVEIEVTTIFGEKETVKLEETLAHSGIFSGSFVLKANEKPEPGNLKIEDGGEPIVETYFGDRLRVRHFDQAASTEKGELELLVDLPVVIGTDGLLAAFSKTFDDEKLAVETKFHVAESYFELFKSHKELGRDDEQKADLEAGRRILREVVEDYPDPKYVPRISYLLGQFAQELGHWDEAITAYETIVRQYSADTLAPDAQYKLAQCYEESGDFTRALEAYVTLAATYPKSPLIANVMIRISDYFYKKENYTVAAQVGEKFLERFETHQHASRLAFRVGQSYYKGKQYTKASDAFDLFVKKFPDDALCADALFWAGESFRMGNAAQEAFRRYNRCRWDFPASEAAKYARGRLTLPEMLQQFESEASSLEDE